MTAPFEPPPEDDFDPGEADYLPPDDEDYPPPSAYTPLSGGDEPNVEAPLSENLEAMVGKAVLKRIQKEADAIAEAKWAEILTPELYARLEAAAAARLLSQLEISLANPEPEPEPEQPAEPELVFGSVEEFVRERIAPVYRREVIEGTSRNWCTQWWKHAEAISRLEALWRAWERLRLDPSTGMSVWWRDHADHHMAQLFDPEGTFKACSVRSGHAGGDFAIVPLPTEPAPSSMFPDMRLSPESAPTAPSPHKEGNN
ncbi:MULTISPECIES: DUF4913 domain-containing protein [Rhodococcus]|uniref:DUF4913 domain-containing protein n=1 Tax=Rhodococcus TaxID=1827 RepID=UPI000366968D|nr:MULTISPECIES: DUF4913 domain-containing protein [Rhodococcus]MDV8015662.1 DUF4913 domain-containing protein [Rhodococcus sp. IEGM 1241]GCB59720.1 hypothetical protein rerp_61280 [Rhodococcus erythropolis]